MNKHVDYTTRPILYSFRRCPYAIRARMALLYSGQMVEIREISLANKPSSLLEYSAKGSVPVLVLSSGEVIEESREIIDWALTQNDPEAWKLGEPDALIDENDQEFKQSLDRYKYADRYPQYSLQESRDQCEVFLQKLERRLSNTEFLSANKLTETDISIIPFIRQFALVDKPWFDQLAYTKVQHWLAYFLNSDQFRQVMKKYPIWQPSKEKFFFQRETSWQGLRTDQV